MQGHITIKVLVCDLSSVYGLDNCNVKCPAAGQEEGKSCLEQCWSCTSAQSSVNLLLEGRGSRTGEHSHKSLGFFLSKRQESRQRKELKDKLGNMRW